MGDVTDELRKVAYEVVKDGIVLLVEMFRDKVKPAKVVIDDKAIRILLLAELTAVDVTMRVLEQSIGSDIDRLNAADEAFRKSSNVQVVDDMSEPWKGEE